jgi:hypothetical protein
MKTHIFSPRNLVIACALIFILTGCAPAPQMSGGAGAPAPTANEAPAADPPAPTPMAVVAPTSASIPAQPALPTQLPIQPAINESRRLTLEFPSRIRIGENDTLRLTLEVDNLGNITPTAEFEGNVVTGKTIEIPDLYDTHNVTAEARFDAAGMQVSPLDAIYEPLKRGQSATFYWSVRPQDTGKFKGTVWLHLNFENRETKEKDRIAISAQIIEIEAVDFFGLSVDVARAGGVVGSVVGGVIGFPFLEDILKFLFKKFKKT